MLHTLFSFMNISHRTARRSGRIRRDGTSNHFHQIRKRVLYHCPVRCTHRTLHRDSPSATSNSRFPSLAFSLTERHASHGAQNRNYLRLSNETARFAAMDTVVSHFFSVSTSVVLSPFVDRPSPSSYWMLVPRFPLLLASFTPSTLP